MLSDLNFTWIYTCSLAYMMNTTGCPISDQQFISSSARGALYTDHCEYQVCADARAQESDYCLYLSRE